MIQKKLQQMGGIAYFLMTSDDVAQFNLSVGDFYHIKITGIGTIDKMLRLYGASKVFTILKKDFEKFPKLIKDDMYDIFISKIETESNVDLNTNPQKFKALVQASDNLRKEIDNLVNKEVEK